MSALRFSFQEIFEEVGSFAELANEFIAPQSKKVLSRFQKALEGYRNSPTEGAFDWEIPDSDPLLTIQTKEYEPGGGGNRFVVGEITSKWRIKREKPAKKSMAAKYFSLAGLASTRVRLRYAATEDGPAEEIAMWRMEVADANAPGCFFHTQILGQSDDPPFPSSLPVPRLPIIMMTPTAVAEFAFAELFQDRWQPHIALQVPHLNRWSPIQQRRLTCILKWKIDQLTKTKGSPWSALKAAQPHADLFIADQR
jgi:hypothetical protein